MSNVIKDFKDENGLWVNRISVNKEHFWTLSGQYHYAMQSRCKVGGSLQRKQNTYIGCVVSHNFNNFQFFTDWCQQQVGYNLDGYQLDKDILVKGNKEYAEDTCVFVPQSMNKFFNTKPAARGLYKIGVSFHKRDLVYTAQLSTDGKVKHLGYFGTEEAAHSAYKKAKECAALDCYERLRDGEFVVDPRVIERMRTWTLDS